MKVYVKKGKKGYKETRMIAELEKVLAEKAREDPTFESSFIPAKDESELRKLHAQYCAEEVTFTETKKEQNPSQTNDQNMSDNTKTGDNSDASSNATETNTTKFEGASQASDPFNREAPKVRDYVLSKDALGNERTSSENHSGTFNEPTTFNEAFYIPQYDEHGNEVIAEGTTQANSGGGGDKNASQQSAPKKVKPEPINPNFNDMDNGRKKRSAKKFAKYVVEAVCVLAKKGFIWYATKDITPIKLAKYELSGEMDLDVLVTLNENQQVTIKQFFQSQCLLAEQLAEISPEEKSDLIETLIEVMLEKGIAPTLTQELMLIAGTVYGGKGLAAFAMNMQHKDLLNQLRDMKQGYAGDDSQQEYTQQESGQQQTNDNVTNTTFEDIDDKVNSAISTKTELETVIETKE